jgi:hypothetical protein
MKSLVLLVSLVVAAGEPPDGRFLATGGTDGKVTIWDAAVLVGAWAAPEKALTPAQAIKAVNKKVIVEMLVKAAKDRLEKRGEIYLDSEEDFRDENNLGIVITKKGAANFKEAGIGDPAAHFLGKTIRVTGTVTIGMNRPRIEVDEAKQIQEVKR